MHKPILLIGIGEMGGVFARGFLRLGYPVYPINRQINLDEASTLMPDPELVLIAVGEKDLPSVLAEIPAQWSDRLCLLQNELLPKDWKAFDHPTVISVWFEKKPGIEAKVIIPSPVYGPQASLISEALGVLQIPTRQLASPQELLFELVVKNVYILTSNLAGLRTGGNVGELWDQHQEFATELAKEIISLQESMTGEKFDAEALTAAMVKAFHGDPAHQCMGRSAPDRLKRALAHAKELQVSTPLMKDLLAEFET